MKIKFVFLKTPGLISFKVSLIPIGSTLEVIETSTLPLSFFVSSLTVKITGIPVGPPSSCV